jgi:cytidyltransferase-like protein
MTLELTKGALLIDREKMALLVPASVAPNVISLAGLICTIQAFHLCYRYYHNSPTLISCVAIALVFAYQQLDALDGIQARRTMNASPVGALWDHACDNIGIVFVALVGCYVTGVEDVFTMWYVVQIAALGLLLAHLQALRAGKLRFGLLNGPGEGIFLFQLGLIACAFFGPQRVIDALSSVGAAPVLRTLLTVQNVYYGMVLYVIRTAFSLPALHKDTRNGILFCLLFRVMPALLFRLGWVREESMLNVVCDGVFVSILSTDVALCLMASGKEHARALHPWMYVFAMVSVLSYFLILAISFAYYVMLFVELTSYLKLPMFTLAVNVYVDGVYDLCHVGHHNIFTAALQHGNRLFVGVLSDEAVYGYKFKYPVMTMQERIAVVSTCKGVYKCIPDAPCPGIPKEFLEKYNIHIVCLSTEYDKPDDKYYALPRQLGMTRVLPRTEGISTSDLIKRVKMYGQESKQVF